jgi:hypothetical protein
LADTLYIPYRKLEEQVDILMKEFLTQQYIKNYNEQNPTDQITQKEFDELFKVMYPYIIPKSMCLEIIDKLYTTVNEKYKEKDVTKEYKEKIIKNVKKKLQ